MLGIFGSYSTYNYFAIKKIQGNIIQVHSRKLRDKINSNLVKKCRIFHYLCSTEENLLTKEKNSFQKLTDL